MNKSLAGGKNGRKSLTFWVPKEERGMILRVMRTCVWYSTGGDLGQAEELALHPVVSAATTGSKPSVLKGISLTEGKQQLEGGRWGHQGGRWLCQDRPAGGGDAQPHPLHPICPFPHRGASSSKPVAELVLGYLQPRPRLRKAYGVCHQCPA